MAAPPSARAPSALHRALLACLIISATPLADPPRALAQEGGGTPGIAELRTKLAAVRSQASAAVPEGTLVSIEYLIETAEQIEARHPKAAPLWRRRAARYLETAAAGRDPYAAEDGKITNRGYWSPISTRMQGYAIYLPPDYDPSRRYPLYVALHGGSSNGNLFLGVVLGNNMDWLTYPQHLYDEYVPRWKPDWIVVAPTGFGQVLWRFMGEQDVLDVIADVERYYSVDPDRVVLGGLSNGGVGAYAMGSRHASRFSMVQAMAGAPSWILFTGGNPGSAERMDLARFSAIDLAENTANTDFRFYHGRVDPGPMRPPFVTTFANRLRSLDLPVNETWYEAGHDILYIVHRHGRVYEQLAEVRRDRHPASVNVVTGDYRANRQHWVTVTRITDYPKLATVHARAAEGTVTVDTDNVTAFALDLRDAPLDGEALVVTVDGAEAYRGPRRDLGHRAHFVRGASGFEVGFPDEPEEGYAKRPGLSGPITDALYDRMIHVYGTGRAEDTETLKEAAERGARGWPLWGWDIRQEVLADTELTEAAMRGAHVVLYATPGSNRVLERMADRLPIRLEPEAVVVGAERYAGRDVGTRFIYPNPESPERYVIVQGALSAAAVKAGNKLPEFLPDWVVYDDDTVRRGQGRITGARQRPRAMGYFDARWRLPAPAEAADPTSTR
jgi:hypothetical protein